MIRLFGLFAGTLLLFSSCRKDIDTFIPDPIDPTGSALIVNATIGGRVIMEGGQPAEGAELRLGNIGEYADAAGVFRLHELNVSADQTYLFAELPGFYPASRMISTSEGSLEFLSLVLMPKEVIQEIDATQEAVVELSSDARIDFMANTLLTVGGDLYSGAAEVYARWLNPADPASIEFLPGALLGIGMDESMRALQDFGVMVIDLTDPQSEPLRIGLGKEVGLRFPIPSSLLTQAPAEIGLWRFQEVNGFWERMGTATLENNYYRAEIGQTGYWLCAVDHPAVQRQAKIIDTDGSPLSFQSVSIRIGGANRYWSGYSNFAGEVKGWFPQDLPLEILLEDDCGEAFYQHSLGNASNWPVQVVNASGAYDSYLAGSLLDCELEPVASGYVLLQLPDRDRVLLTKDGQFYTFFTSCDGEPPLVSGFDFLQEEESQSVLLETDFMPSAGPLLSCDGQNEFLAFRLDSDDLVGKYPVGYQQDSILYLVDDLTGLSFRVLADQPGLYNVDPGEFVIGTHSTQTIDQFSVQCRIDHLGQPGDYLSGTLGGFFTDLQGNAHSIAGSFRAVREF